MNPNIPQEIQNAMNSNQIATMNIVQQNSPSIQRISITKTEEKKELIQPNANNNNFNDNPQIIKETKIITTTYNILGPQQNILHNINTNDNSYKALIKKIANQLKTKVRQPTMGFFNFALQKGEYSLMIIKRIAPQLQNHQIQLNNEVFRIYTQKYQKYRELIKKIAHLLKISIKTNKIMNNSINANNAPVTTVTRNTTTTVNTVIIDNNRKSDHNNVKKVSNKSEQINKINNMIQKKTKIQTQKQTQKNTFKTYKNNKNINTNRYNNTNNNISHKRINPDNPFFFFFNNS